MQEIESARILIVDDEPANVRLIERILRGDGFHHLVSTTDPTEVLTLFAREKPDLILLDLWMPEKDGFQVLEDLVPWIPQDSYLPILVLTGDTSSDVKARALQGGARDFLTKPFSPGEVLLRIRNLLETRMLHLRLEVHNHLLEEMVRERTRDLQQARFEILERLARAAEYRDDQTGEHTRRVGEMAGHLAARIGAPAEHVELIRRAAPLHDVGKIGIPDGVLLKPGRLSSKELDLMRQHCLIGANLLSGSGVPLLDVAATIALTHHERWDGTGYPEGLEGESIPLAGRVVAVVDVYDALVHERPYKAAFTQEEAMAELEQGRGTHFDPQVVEAFLAMLREGEIPAPAARPSQDVEFAPMAQPESDGGRAA
ncbi:MAG TPA: HD domain-containing phosphohydrolase [Longimicrobiales bacterium]|nr:HD domain-containing phosphohydrolase [Longimicrobiales bacterium]